MNVILGIDTGGTFTDGVLLNYHTKEVVRGVKVPTTKESLLLGINNCIEALSIEDEEHVCLVCLSSTLATNAIVENRGAEVGLITIGNSAEAEFPAAICINIRGKMDVMGREVENVFESEICQALKNMKGHIDTLAVSGYASVKNPRHELIVKRLAEEILDVPVICAHQLSSTLGFSERTTTAVLNAKLIPLIRRLLNDMETVLRERSIEAPVMIMKGDGHEIIGSFALEYPVETILSGPVASMIGGKFLTGLQDGLVVDIGGTTTDIICLNQGEGMLESEGMCIGGWKTKVKSLKVFSAGLGGDSWIRLDHEGNLSFGPRRVEPLCAAALDYPALIDELQEYRLPDDYVVLRYHDGDCVRRLRNGSEDWFSEQEAKIMRYLEDAPHSLVALAKWIGTDVDMLQLERLEEKQWIQFISLTPTDLLHVSGEYRYWNHAISCLVVRLLAERKKMSEAHFLAEAETEFVRLLSKKILEAIFMADGMTSDDVQAEGTKFFVEHFLNDNGNDLFTCDIRMQKPIIAVGAAASWIQKAAARLGIPCILPEYASMANAVGAAAGDVREERECHITFDPLLKQYIVYLPDKKLSFESLENAETAAEEELKADCESLAVALQLEDFDIDMKKKDKWGNNVCTGENTFMYMKIIASVKGRVQLNT